MAIIVFLISFTVYMITLCPTVYVGDAGELIVASHVLGIAHPPGYPIYCLLNKAFSFLFPYGNIALRMNCASSFFASLSVLFIYLIFKIIFKNKILSATGALIFAFTKTFWSQANTAEVYTLNTFFLLASIYILILWHQKRETHLLSLFSLVYGLSITNHHTMILFMPVYIFIAFTTKKWLNMFSFFLLGISIYLYMPFRSLSNPAVDWGNPENFSNLLYHIIRGQYGTMSNSSRSFYLFFEQILHYFRTLKDQFSFLILIFAIPGIFSIFKNNKTYFFVCTYIFLTSIIFILLINFKIDIKSLESIKVFYIPSYLAVIIWIVSGIQLLLEKISNKTVVYFLSLPLFLVPLSKNYFECNLSRNYLAYEYNVNILNTVEENHSMFFTYGDNIMFPILYLREIENIQKQIYIFDDIGCIFGNIYGDDFLRIPEKEKKKRRNQIQRSIIKSNRSSVYFVLGSNPSNMMIPGSHQAGVIYKIGSASNESLLWRKYRMASLHVLGIFKDYLNRDLIAHYYFFKGQYFLSRGTKELAINEYRKAFEIGNDMDWVKNNLITALIKEKLYDVAKEFALESLELNPDDSQMNVNLGIIYYNKEKLDEAVKCYKKSLEIDKQNSEAYTNLGVVYEKKGLFEQAVNQYEIAISVDPANAIAHYNLGVIYNKQDKWKEAVQEFEKAIENAPDLIEGYISMGIILGKRNFYDDAIKIFMKAVEIAPLAPQSHYNLGIAYAKKGEIQKAKDEWKETLKLDPSHSSAKMALQRFK